MIPYINRTLDLLLPDALEARDVNVREVIDEFRGQCDNFFDTFEAFVYIAPGRFRVTCKSTRKLAAVESATYFIRGHPVTFQAVSQYKWVNITRLSYGVPDDAIRAVLSAYGTIKLIKSETYATMYTGIRNVLMEIKTEIPSRLRIANHWCALYYKGQVRKCFIRGQEGHFSRRCPEKSSTQMDVSVAPPGDSTVDPPGDVPEDSPAVTTVDPPSEIPTDPPGDHTNADPPGEIVPNGLPESIDPSAISADPPGTAPNVLRIPALLRRMFCHLRRMALPKSLLAGLRYQSLVLLVLLKNGLLVFVENPPHPLVLVAVVLVPPCVRTSLLEMLKFRIRNYRK